MVITPEQLKHRFPGLTERFERDELATLLDMLVSTAPPSGEQLHRYGDRADSLYLIWEGSLALSMEAAGTEIPLGALGSGQHIGSVAVIEPGPAPTTVTVAEPSKLLCLAHASFSTLRTQHPRLASHFLQALSLDLAERLRLYEEEMLGRTQPPSNPEELARLCRPLMGIKIG